MLTRRVMIFALLCCAACLFSACTQDLVQQEPDPEPIASDSELSEQAENTDTVPAEDTEFTPPDYSPQYLVDAFSPEIPSLHEVYAPYFKVGAAIDPNTFHDEKYTQTIEKHYNVLTASGAMKQKNLNPSDGKYFFDTADKFVDYAESIGAQVRGHTLIWHDSVPEFWFFNEDGTKVTREALLERMETHITTVVERYKGRVDVWDVVNEPLSDIDGMRGEDQNAYYASIIGDIDGDGNAWDYVEYAFRWADAADPDATLILNEYGLESDPQKLNYFCEMLEDMLQKGVPIDGVGLQMHVKLSKPYAVDVKNCIERLSEFQKYNPAFCIQITELDVSIFESGDDRTTRTLDAKLQRRLAERYRELFDVFVEVAESANLDSVITWGVYDGANWLDYYPVANRRNAPLLFDRLWKAKPAFWALAAPEELENALAEYEDFYNPERNYIEFPKS